MPTTPPIPGGVAPTSGIQVMPVIGLGQSTVLVFKPAPPAATKKSKARVRITLAGDVIVAAGTMPSELASGLDLAGDVVWAVSHDSVSFPSIQLAADTTAAAGSMHTLAAAGITLGPDTVLAESGVDLTIALAGDVVAVEALSEVQTSIAVQLYGDFPVGGLGAADVASGHGHLVLGSDVVIGAGAPSTIGTVSVSLGSDLVAAGAAGGQVASSVLVLGSDLVASVALTHDVTVADSVALTLASDLVSSPAIAAASSAGQSSLVLAGDVLAGVLDAAPPIIAATSGASRLHLADDAVYALDGRSWGRVGRHQLNSDTVAAGASVVMPSSDGTVGLTLADDAFQIIPEANQPPSAAPDIGLADDVVDAGSFADRPAGRWADPYGATAVPEALLAGV